MGTEKTEAVSEIRKGLEGLQELEGILEILEPSGQIVIVDTFGTEHQIRAMLPARRQIRALRVLEEMFEDFSGMIDSLRGLQDGEAVKVLRKVFSQVLGSDKMILLLGKAFAAAHPQVIQVVMERGIKEGEIQKGTDPGVAVCDLFPLEEVIGGLVPLFYRAVVKMIAAGKSLNLKE